jgi:hypothetical protein
MKKFFCRKQGHGLSKVHDHSIKTQQKNFELGNSETVLNFDLLFR